MKKILSLGLTVCFLLTSNNIYAGDVVSKVKVLSAVNETTANVFLFKPIDITGHPCATSGYYVSFDKTTEHGKLMYVTILTAVATNQDVHFFTSNTVCTLWGNQATLVRVNIHNY